MIVNFFVLAMSIFNTVENNLFKFIKMQIVFGIKTLLFDEFPEAFDYIEIG
jgi:hypothetical protein